jgi:hypothetical protein
MPLRMNQPVPASGSGHEHAPRAPGLPGGRQGDAETTITSTTTAATTDQTAHCLLQRVPGVCGNAEEQLSTTATSADNHTTPQLHSYLHLITGTTTN